MPSVEVDGNVFEFESSCRVEKYDEWNFYKERILGSVEPGAAKGCDLVVIDGSTLYLIEAKDYTSPPGTTMPKVAELAATVSTKGLHTLGGLNAGARIEGLPQEDFCRAALKCTRVVLCLALEPPGNANSQLWAKKPLADMATALKRRVKYLSPRPVVLANASSHANVPWESHRLAVSNGASR